MKPPGIEMVLRDGALCVGVTRSNRVMDQIWEAVQEAVSENWTPQQFLSEVYQAWDHERSEQKKSELKELGNALRSLGC